MGITELRRNMDSEFTEITFTEFTDRYKLCIISEETVYCVV